MPRAVPPFHEYLGIEVERMEHGEASASLVLAPHHCNRRGVVHGGVMAALLDTALGAAVVSSIPSAWWCATISLSVQFLEGARQGRLRASGRVLRRGRRVAFAGGEVRDESGRLVATAQGSWHLWPYQPQEGASARAGEVVVQDTGERLRVGKILAVGRNYADHAAEMGLEAGARPVWFLKPPTAIVHDGGIVRLPPGARELHHEVEMVVVVGQRVRAVPEERALDCVLGFAVGLDLTLRDLQREAKARGEPWTLAKGFDGAAPVSSVAPRERVGDGSGLRLTLDVNGERRQEASTSAMLWSVPRLLAEASRWMTLERGDLIFTGTPSGVGPARPGDRLQATLAKVASLEVTIAPADAADERPQWT